MERNRCVKESSCSLHNTAPQLLVLLVVQKSVKKEREKQEHKEMPERGLNMRSPANSQERGFG